MYITQLIQICFHHFLCFKIVNHENIYYNFLPIEEEKEKKK